MYRYTDDFFPKRLVMELIFVASRILPCMLMFFHIRPTVGSDPCQTNRILDFMEIRFKEYHAKTKICDRFNIPTGGAWYRAEGQDMVTSAPFLNETCGTLNPIWLKGHLPKNRGVQISAKACIPGVSTDCDDALSVKVKNCGKFNVYFLLRPPSCPQAYCFEFSTKGRPPTEKIDGKPTVKHTLERIKGGRMEHTELQFKCDFPKKSQDVFYQIQWYIDGTPSALAPPKLYHLLDRDTYLQEHVTDSNKGYTKMGINVACKVRLKLDVDGPPGPSSEISDPLFAGIKITQHITVNRSNPEGVIQLRPTVPFGCPIELPSCPLQIEMFVPGNHSTCESVIKTMKEPILAADNAGLCGYNINGTSWRAGVDVKIALGDTGKYELDIPGGRFIIAFRTLNRKSFGNNQWGEYVLPEVHVHVIDDTDVAKGKTCHAVSDPHMMTFDGCKYENQKPGKFILYRGRSQYSKEIQVEVTHCNFAYKPAVYCVCALAVRAGNDLFLIDRCPRRRLTINFLSCGDDLLDSRKVTELEYKIYFPSGMYVHAVLDDNYLGDNVKTMNVFVYPSLTDGSKTMGLCGTLNKDRSDDFHDRKEGTKPIPLSKFINAWRVDTRKGDFDLIAMNHADALNLPHRPATTTYCTCSSQTTTQNRTQVDFFQLKSCLSSNAVTCVRDDIKLSSQNCHIRRKRSLKPVFTYKPDNFIFSPDAITVSRAKFKRSIPAKGWTKGDALTYCKNFMNQSTTFRACEKVPNVKPESSLEDCALDIVLTNTTDWADFTRRSMRASCMKELKMNNTLSEPKGNNTKSLAEEIKEISCPSDCSGNGLCQKGKCLCKNGYGALDCSKNLNDPPIVYGVNIDDGGICDVGDCPFASVEGDGFLDTKKLRCKMEYFEATTNNSVTAIHNVSVKAKHDSLAVVHCPLPKRGKRAATSISDAAFVHGYTIFISNNDKSFSPGHRLYLLDSRCQDTVNISGSLGFVLKDHFCFIGATCIPNGETQSSNKCNQCDSVKDPLSWTWTPGCTLKPSETLSSSTVIGLTVGLILFLVVFIVAGVILYRLYRSNGSTSALERAQPNYKGKMMPESKTPKFSIGSTAN